MTNTKASLLRGKQIFAPFEFDANAAFAAATKSEPNKRLGTQVDALHSRCWKEFIYSAHFPWNFLTCQGGLFLTRETILETLKLIVIHFFSFSPLFSYQHTSINLFILPRIFLNAFCCPPLLCHLWYWHNHNLLGNPCLLSGILDNIISF